ncbi:MAG: hypothetical protein OHK003_22750 [Anaerolineales bacterium]
MDVFVGDAVGNRVCVCVGDPIGIVVAVIGVEVAGAVVPMRLPIKVTPVLERIHGWLK